MNTLADTAPAFVEMAHQIVWASVTTVDRNAVPRSRILHPFWVFDGVELVGWIGTGKTPVKAAHLAANPNVSVSYWAPTHDTCAAVCRAEWADDPETREWLWDAFKNAPAPLGFDPAMIPGWDSPASESFMVLRLTPIHLRVFPGTALTAGVGDILTWTAP
ncbi:MAG: pyridoxamine 5'-phosphate oxidase family protein [Acidimicrobiales bacterium]|nr:pyridoxamine 5'-phosphate oxidase family protein [Acidimicrobiales bacterium]